MFELDQRFTNKPLPDAELLREFAFNNLIPRLKAARKDRVLQGRHDLRLLGDRLQFLKGGCHGPLLFCGLPPGRELTRLSMHYTITDSSICGYGGLSLMR